MAREMTGWVGKDDQGRWFYRYQYTDASQIRRNIRRLAKSETNAKKELRKALNRMEQQGMQSVEGDRLRFIQLIDRYKERRVYEATYVGETKVGGLRSLAHVEMLIRTLTRHFQNRLVKMITHSEIEQFKLLRLNTPKDNGEQRSIASVNRELELLRAVMNFAKREGFILRSPFEQGSSLISKADETRRSRVLSYEEENRLLAACDVTIYEYVRFGRSYEVADTAESFKRRQQLKTIIITAVDTAMRRGEIFKLEWRDVDLESGEIVVRAFNSKTAQERSIGITPRLITVLQKLWNPSKLPFDKVFDYDKPDSTIKRVWQLHVETLISTICASMIFATLL